jgi:hypothetical protein
MPDIRYSIAPDIFKLFPGYCRGVVVARGFTNRPSAPAVTALLREAEAALRQRITGNVAEVPEIAAWREAYRRFGAKPSEHRSAIEALARRVLKPDQLPAINTLVDIGNLVSIKYLLPAGVHPTDALPARRGAAPGPRGRPVCPARRQPGRNAAGGRGGVCRRRPGAHPPLDLAASRQHPDAARNARRVLQHRRPATHHTRHVQAATAEVAQLVQAHCGGEVLAVLLDADNPGFSLG